MRGASKWLEKTAPTLQRLFIAGVACQANGNKHPQLRGAAVGIPWERAGNERG